jgi:hypothetical protein
MNTFDAVMIAETGDISEPEVVEAWQHLIDTGIVWSLQGWFGRTARDLIENGVCRPAKSANDN